MKNILKFLLTLLIFVSCNEKNSNQNTSEIKVEINIILDDWHLSAANADFSNYFSKMDSASVFIGTDASENWNKKQFKKFSKPYFDRGKAWSFKPVERNMYVGAEKKIVWFDELLDTWMGICRGSGVLEKTKNSWKIKHYILSVAIPNDAIQKVITVKKEKDSLLLREILSKH
ncbi:MAG: hypothetical protein GKR88_17330 [Flavobacteriaceae bacterium]|nr:MAG: hypothetical protein GKR88_17330 [Flavobacteriaceae bacterium]